MLARQGRAPPAATRPRRSAGPAVSSSAFRLGRACGPAGSSSAFRLGRACGPSSGARPSCRLGRLVVSSFGLGRACGPSSAVSCADMAARDSTGPDWAQGAAPGRGGLEHVAQGQTRFFTPGVAPDPRGILLGRFCLMTFPTLEGAVSWFRLYSSEASLDELLAELAITRCRTALGAARSSIRIPAVSSYAGDRAARLARLVGGAIYTGTRKHFVKYRDDRSPYGYDAVDIGAMPARHRLHGARRRVRARATRARASCRSTACCSGCRSDGCRAASSSRADDRGELVARGRARARRRHHPLPVAQPGRRRRPGWSRRAVRARSTTPRPSRELHADPRPQPARADPRAVPRHARHRRVPPGQPRTPRSRSATRIRSICVVRVGVPGRDASTCSGPAIGSTSCPGRSSCPTSRT